MMQRLIAVRPIPTPSIQIFPNACAIPADVLAWAERQALAHEQEWGFDEDSSVDWPLCGWRGSVAFHRDVECTEGEIVFGLIVKAREQYLGADGFDGWLKLEPGTLYKLDPFTRHGTRCTASDDDALLLFLLNTIGADNRQTPEELAGSLLSDARRAMTYSAAAGEPRA